MTLINILLYFRYNPAPSVLHHAQTMLREPVYWKMIEKAVGYVTNFKRTLEPFDLSIYETEEYKIIPTEPLNITTYFEQYQYEINEALNCASKEEKYKNITYAARQRRLQHEPFSFKFTIESKIAKDVVIRLFIGPNCNISNCFNNSFEYFELDNQRMKLREGTNNVVWSPNKSSHLSNDDAYNLETKNVSGDTVSKQTYSSYKFPGRLIIPKGTEDGINLKLFVIVTNIDPDFKQTKDERSLYKELGCENDEKPLGFPFHGPSFNFNENANNYKFSDVHVFHKHIQEKVGYFSPNLN